MPQGPGHQVFQHRPHGVLPLGDLRYLVKTPGSSARGAECGFAGPTCVSFAALEATKTQAKASTHARV